MLQNEYFVIEAENNKPYPMFAWDQSIGDYGLGHPVQAESEPIQFIFGDPIPENFEWADYHVAPQPVFSTRLASVVQPLDLLGIQFVPAKVSGSNGPFAVIHDYWFVHIFNRIACLDKNQSEFDSYDDGNIFSIDELVLDEDVLNKIDEKDRLLFELAEKTSVLIIHKSLKDIIESIHSTGIRFFPVSQWNSDSAFD